MKKMIVAAGIAALTTLISAQAFALECEISTNLSDTHQTLTLDITGDQQYEKIAVRILKPGSGVGPDTAPEDFLAMLVAGRTLETDADKKTGRSFTLPADLAAGEYIIDLKTDSGEQWNQSYFLYGFDELNTNFQTICESEDPQAVRDAFLSYGGVIGFKLEKMKLLLDSEQTEAAALFLKNRESVEDKTVETMQAALDEAVMVQRIKTSNGAQNVFEEYEPVLKLKESQLYLENSKDMEVAKLAGWYKRIAAQAKTAANAEELQAVAQEQLPLHLINALSIWNSTKTVVEKNYERLGLTAEDVKSVPDKVYMTICGKNYATKAEFKTAFDNAKKNGGDDNNDKPKPPSGGPSGNGTSLPSVSMITDGKKPEADPGPEKFRFADVEEQAEWAAEAVSALYEKGVVKGKTETEFAPGDSITREEFTTLVVNMCGLEASAAQALFSDVPDEAWYAPYVAAAYENGLVSGVSETQFGAGMKITRQDMAVIIARAISAETGSQSSFADQEEIAGYALDAVGYLSANGVINGKADNRFCPADFATRAEAAQMIYKAMQLKQWI